MTHGDWEAQERRNEMFSDEQEVELSEKDMDGTYFHELTGIEEHEAHEFNSTFDDKRERYGDPCPGCGTLRWQGDCPNCYTED